MNNTPHEHTALSSARSNVRRALFALLSVPNEAAETWKQAREDPTAALAIAANLDNCAGALITAISLLRHEALTSLEAAKGGAQ
jgi:hypothetical protein